MLKENYSRTLNNAKFRQWCKRIDGKVAGDGHLTECVIDGDVWSDEYGRAPEVGARTVGWVDTPNGISVTVGTVREGYELEVEDEVRGEVIEFDGQTVKADGDSFTV